MKNLINFIRNMFAKLFGKKQQSSTIETTYVAPAPKSEPKAKKLHPANNRKRTRGRNIQAIDGKTIIH